MLRFGAIVLVATIVAAAPIPSKPSQHPSPSALEGTQPQQGNPTTQPNVSSNNGAPANKDTPAPGLVFSPKIDVVTREGAHRGEGDSAANWWLVAFTAGLLITAVVTFFVFRRQARIMGETLAQMKTDSANQSAQFERQFQLIKQNTDSASEAAKAASENAKAALNSGRAHIWMKDIRLTLKREPDQTIKKMECDYHIWNAGTTPGIAKGVYMQSFYGSKAAWPNVPTYDQSNVSHVGFVGPNSGHTKQVSFHLSEEGFSLQDVRDEKLVFIVFGYVVYTDIVKPEIDHRAGFAYQILFDGTADVSTKCSFQGPEAYWTYS